MPDTKTQRRPATRTEAPACERIVPPGKRDATSAVERTTELSEDVFRELEDGAQSAIEAVRKFLETVDEALPLHGEGRSRGEEITDSAMEMAQRLVHTQADFLRKVVDSAGRSLRSPDSK